MPIQILMPALSPTMEEGELTKWLVREGDSVSAGQVIAEIETDKATMEVEAVDEGILGKILVGDGASNVKVNTPIALIFEEDEDIGNESIEKYLLKYKKQKEQKNTSELQVKNANLGVNASSKLSYSKGLEYSKKIDEKEKVSIGQPDMLDAVKKASLNSEIPLEIPEGATFKKMSVREALCEAMAEEMRRDDNVFVIGEEVAEYNGAYKVTQGLLDMFGPKRVVDTPITEHAFAGLGVGAAFSGLRPIVEFMTFNFAMQAIDQIINSAAKTLYMSGGQIGCPIVFRGPNGPALRVAAQHSQDYASWYAHIPGLKVIAPFSSSDAKGLLKAAIRDPNPVIFLENEILYGRSFDVPEIEEHVLPIGKAKIIKNGHDVTIVSYSHAILYCLDAIEQLEREDISCELIDLRTLRPLDISTVLESVKKTNRIVSVDETWPVCGIGSEIAAQVQEKAFDYLDAPILKVTQKDVPMPYAANLERITLPCAQDIVTAVKTVCYRL